MKEGGAAARPLTTGRWRAAVVPSPARPTYHRPVTERGFAGPDVACPFVAFDDDRNLRAEGPDPRHRCYAEVRPAPRAIAHQEAFCLSPNFGRCPTFLDWARREAAQVVPSHAGRAGATGRPSLPWAAGGSPSEADALTRAKEAEVAPPAFLAGSAGAELPAAPVARQGVGEGTPTVPPAGLAEPLGHGGPVAPAAEAPSLEVGGPRLTRPVGEPRRPAGRIPGWERPRRWESYPALPRPRGSSTASSVLVAALLVALGAVVLFFVPPMLLERGTAGPVTSPTSPALPSASASPLPSPSPSPAATPFVYVVQQGDTLTRIARHFGVTIDQIVAANAGTLKDPNVLQIGDRLVIPTPVPSVISDAGGTPSPSP